MTTRRWYTLLNCVNHSQVIGILKLKNEYFLGESLNIFASHYEEAVFTHHTHCMRVATRKIIILHFQPFKIFKLKQMKGIENNALTLISAAMNNDKLFISDHVCLLTGRWARSRRLKLMNRKSIFSKFENVHT